MRSESTAKKDTQKLQRAIVDGLEDVKAQDIQVFDSEHLSPLFERVIIASGTSNRQTRALALSVRDAVHKAGFDKPRMEGEENGEWIIVDCGGAVVHIMQPAIRQYYTLEQIWGDKPVRMRLGAPKPLPVKKEKKATTKKVAKKDAEPVADAAEAKPAKAPKKAVKTADIAEPAKKPATKRATAPKPVAAKAAVGKAPSAPKPRAATATTAKSGAAAKPRVASAVSKARKTATTAVRKTAAKK